MKPLRDQDTFRDKLVETLDAETMKAQQSTEQSDKLGIGSVIIPNAYHQAVRHLNEYDSLSGTDQEIASLYADVLCLNADNRVRAIGEEIRRLIGDESMFLPAEDRVRVCQLGYEAGCLIQGLYGDRVGEVTLVDRLRMSVEAAYQDMMDESPDGYGDRVMAVGVAYALLRRYEGMEGSASGVMEVGREVDYLKALYDRQSRVLDEVRDYPPRVMEIDAQIREIDYVSTLGDESIQAVETRKSVQRLMFEQSLCFQYIGQ